MCELEDRFGKYDGFEYRPRVPRNSLVGGVGINDAPFVLAPTINGRIVKHPAYEVWKQMLVRCFDTNYKAKFPTYKDVTCCISWLSLSSFTEWVRDTYKPNSHLDKDLLIGGNRIYSPKTCLFIPQEINKFLTLSSKARGSYPLGVNLHHGRFQATIRSGKHLGTFDTPELAHKAWQKAKLEQAIAFNFPPLQRVIDQLKFEIENNLETTTL
jgi:hypothetical protein